MDLNGIEKKYEYLGIAELSYEISDLSDEELRDFYADMKTAGWKFCRTELRYKSCLVAVFNRILI